MELQARTDRVRQMVETLVQRTVSRRWKYPKTIYDGMKLQEGLAKLPALFSNSLMDDERIVDYLVYQIYRCRNAIKEGKWVPSWLFSQNALDKYRNQFLSENGKSGMNYYIDQWLRDSNLSRSKLTAMIAESKPNPLRKFVDMRSEEPVKRRFLNTPEGLTLCLGSTTGWSPFSQACNDCGNNADCERMSENKYPELIRLRKEEYGKEK